MSNEAPIIMLDGYVLNDHFAIRDLKRPWPSVQPNTVQVSGRAGAVLRNMEVGTRSVSFKLGATDEDHQKLAAMFRWILELLAGDGTHVLSFSDEGGFLRHVVLDATPSYDEYVGGALVELEFTMPDPYLIDSGETTITVPSGGSVQFRVTHSRPSIVISAASAVRDSTSQLWGIRFDDGDFLRVKIPTSSATPVSFDCLERRVVVGGATSMVTLTSDWPILDAGFHTAQMDVGTGAATLTIKERCL